MRIKSIITLLFLMCVTCLFSQETGNATYYHKRFHGSRTSDGGVYHKDSMTCAHRTYPLGTLLHVKNPRNEKEKSTIENIKQETSEEPISNKVNNNFIKLINVAKIKGSLYKKYLDKVTAINPSAILCRDDKNRIEIYFGPFMSARRWDRDDPYVPRVH